MHRRGSPLALAPLLSLVLVMVIGLALPSAAVASAYTQVEAAYSRSNTGILSPCTFSSATLEAALGQAPSYDYQYQADFTAAIQAALAARANGECRSGHTRVRVVGALGPGAQLKGMNTTLPASVDSATSAGLPLVLALLFGLAGLCLLGAAVWGVLNLLGYDPLLGRAARHSMREAQYRAGGHLDDLSDRLRR